MTALEVSPEEGSRLAILHAAYANAKAKADSAVKELKAITDGLKLEITQNAGDCLDLRYRLSGPGGPALALTWVVSNRLDTTRIKRELPDVAEQYTTASGAWQLREAKGGEE